MTLFFLVVGALCEVSRTVWGGLVQPFYFAKREGLSSITIFLAFLLEEFYLTCAPDGITEL